MYKIVYTTTVVVFLYMMFSDLGPPMFEFVTLVIFYYVNKDRYMFQLCMPHPHFTPRRGQGVKLKWYDSRPRLGSDPLYGLNQE